MNNFDIIEFWKTLFKQFLFFIVFYIITFFLMWNILEKKANWEGKYSNIDYLYSIYVPTTGANQIIDNR